MKRSNFEGRKNKRIDEATARQAKYESMTIDDRIARLDKLGLVAKKERAKLEKLKGGK